MYNVQCNSFPRCFFFKLKNTIKCFSVYSWIIVAFRPESEMSVPAASSDPSPRAPMTSARQPSRFPNSHQSSPVVGKATPNPLIKVHLDCLSLNIDPYDGNLSNVDYVHVCWKFTTGEKQFSFQAFLLNGHHENLFWVNRF